MYSDTISLYSVHSVITHTVYTESLYILHRNTTQYTLYHYCSIDCVTLYSVSNYTCTVSQYSVHNQCHHTVYYIQCTQYYYACSVHSVTIQCTQYHYTCTKCHYLYMYSVYTAAVSLYVFIRYQLIL